MKRIFLSLFALLVFSTLIFAEVIIPKEHRVKNRSPGYCAWCCMEALGRAQGIKELVGLVDRRSKESDFKVWDANKRAWVQSPYVWVNYGNGRWLKKHRSSGVDQAIKNRLNKLGIKFRYQPNGNYSMDIINYGMKNGLGVMIVVDWKGFDYKYAFGQHTHAVILTDINKKQIKFIDPNKPDKVWYVEREWFDAYWHGEAWVLEKDQ